MMLMGGDDIFAWGATAFVLVVGVGGDGGTEDFEKEAIETG